MTQVKERPILFSAPMVRAILDDRKTVTRRPVKGDQIPHRGSSDIDGCQWIAVGQHDRRYGFIVSGSTEEECAAELAIYGRCPYGKPGDRLWVRETTEADYDTTNGAVLSRYAADREPVLYARCEDPEYNGSVAHWDYPRDSRPSIHMHRWVCRILLEVAAVRVERLQDISEDQAKAEGCFFTDYGRKCGHGGKGWTDVGSCPAPEAHHPQLNGWMWDKTTSHEQCLGAPRWAFANLWNAVNGPDAWDANPWVWVIEFKRVTP
ncbi:hypothetical protein ACFFQ5_02770 [Pseudomonas brassicacearum]|uniref:hypothetical protein n=1 Tax=Pseudomonas TaxID=286 RepID=UPI00025FE06C|nr:MULTISPECIES: hypothetical protein [Pseudomonas]EIK65965.1 hypothetical protein PflQ8_3775 [Pseudomonas fluorescens Q8r1-96]KAB0523514.1 hypothetical protein F7R20_20190 [Pseudomonas brassicacearum subsp. brassicacearum]NJP61470.1 hypothetical protein [Pseudomonas brassicacearum]QEO79705.1 hypothetical protein ELZ14_19845 [Pseudomonas brassicacearum]SDP69797.1 hypothetical protein SAMN04490180_2457 [Pseudomonas brassicacearum]